MGSVGEAVSPRHETGAFSKKHNGVEQASHALRWQVQIGLGSIFKQPSGGRSGEDAIEGNAASADESDDELSFKVGLRFASIAAPQVPKTLVRRGA